MTTDVLPLRRVDHVRFFVGNARQSAYFYRNAFGFDEERFFRGAREVLDAIAAFWDGLEADRLANVADRGGPAQDC